MATVFPNFVEETCSSPGTGTVTLLGPVTGKLDFDSQCSNGDVVTYTIENDTQKETGFGIFSTGPDRLARSTILYSTNGGAAVNFTGTCTVTSSLAGNLLQSLMDPAASTGLIARTAANTYAPRTLVASMGLAVADGDGIAGNPTITGLYKSALEFGADPTPAFDNATAFAAMVTYASTETYPSAIVFPAGVYEYSVSPNWAVEKLEIICRGDVRFRYTGTGNAVILDGGATGPGIFDVRMGRIYVEAPSTAASGVYMRSIHHGKFDFNVRGCGAAYAGLYMEWCVANDIRYVCSVNEGGGGWYTSAQPGYGLWMDHRADSVFNTCTANRFVLPIIEGTDTGALLDGAQFNRIVGGTIESCDTIGLITTSSANYNWIEHVDFEVNGGAFTLGQDISLSGRENYLVGVMCDSLIEIESGAQYNKILGGSFQNFTVNSGALYTVIDNASFNRVGGAYTGVFTDSGTSSLITNLIDQKTGDMYPRLGRATYDAALTSAAQTVSASPYTYVNNTGLPVAVSVTGGTITAFTFCGVSRTCPGFSPGIYAQGIYELSPGDQITIEWTSAPTVIVHYR